MVIRILRVFAENLLLLKYYVVQVYSMVETSLMFI